jgi:hypothetical protein
VSVYQLSRDVQTLLHDKGFPLRVHYGPERTHREGYPDNVVIFERDREASDTLGPARGAQRNPRKLRSRGLQGVVTLHVRNSKASAHIGDHETLCEKFVDALLVALVKWATATAAIDFAINESRYLSADERLAAAGEQLPGVDATKIEQWPGVVYRIKFTLPRALFDLDYAGDGSPTGTAATQANRTDVYLTGAGSAEEGDPVVGCDSTPEDP